MEENRIVPEAENPDIAATESPAAPKKNRNFPTLGDVLALLGIFLVGQLIGMFAGIIFGFASSGETTLEPEAMGKWLGVTSLIAYVVTLVGMLVYRSVRGGRGPVVRFSLKGFNPALILWGFLLMVAVGVVLEPLLNLLPSPSLVKFGTGVWTMASLVLFAPVFEELICRGVVLESLRSRYGVMAAWLGSSFFFAMLHFQQPQLVVNAFFMGLILAFLYIRTDSIWIAIILHALNNAIAYVLMVMGFESLMVSDMIDSRTIYLGVYVAAAALCFVSGVMVYRTLKRIEERDKNSAKA